LGNIQEGQEEPPQTQEIVLSRNAKQCRKELAAKELCINGSRRGRRRILKAFAVSDCSERNFLEVRCKFPFLGNLSDATAENLVWKAKAHLCGMFPRNLFTHG